MGDLLQPWHLLILFFVACLFIVPVILYIRTLSRLLRKCSIASRVIEPRMLWLLLVPWVNLVLHFFVVLGIAKSLSNEFAVRGITGVEPRPGWSVGIAMCVFGACEVIPLPSVRMIAIFAHLVLWLVYWNRVAELSAMLDQSPAVGAIPNQTI
jgi:hypothetical protein